MTALICKQLLGITALSDYYILTCSKRTYFPEWQNACMVKFLIFGRFVTQTFNVQLFKCYNEIKHPALRIVTNGRAQGNKRDMQLGLQRYLYR